MAVSGARAGVSRAVDLGRDHLGGDRIRLHPRLVVYARLLIFAAFAAYNAFWFWQLAIYARNGFPLNDWWLLSSIDPATPYATHGFHWAMPAAWAWVYLIEPVGFGLWSLLHLAAILTLPRKVIVVALVTFPFWADVAAGNTTTFAFVLAWHALAGRRWAIVGFVVMTALIPRPLLIPVLAVLLWRSWDARIGFALATVAVVATGLATGTLLTYIQVSVGTASEEWYVAASNIGPSSYIGAAWVPIGIVLGAIAFRYGRLGLSSILVTPYLIHYYALFALLELRRDQSVDDRRVDVQRAGRAGLRPAREDAL